MQSKPVSPQPYIENAAGASAARPAGKKGEPTNLSEENVGFQPSSDLQALVTDLRALPEVRAEVVADAVRRLQTGELFTPGAAADAAKAILDLNE